MSGIDRTLTQCSGSPGNRVAKWRPTAVVVPPTSPQGPAESASLDLISYLHRQDLYPICKLLFTNQQDIEITMETQRLRDGAMVQLSIAMSALPDLEKADFLIAQRVCPQVVATESDPLRFLRFTNFDPWAAALRLAKYWKMRREIFGNQAFLPMTLTGDGALSEEDITVIRAGSLVLLPYDNEGRSVLCVDMTRRPDETIQKRMRTIFYFIQKVSENETCFVRRL